MLSEIVRVTRPGSRHYLCFPGQGDLAIQPFMAALQVTGFDGLLSLEIFSDRFRAGSARRIAIDGQRSLLFMLDELRETTAVGVPGTSPLPPRSRVEAIEFLEFAMDEPSGFDTADLKAAKALLDALQYCAKSDAKQVGVGIL